MLKCNNHNCGMATNIRDGFVSLRLIVLPPSTCEYSVHKYYIYEVNMHVQQQRVYSFQFFLI